MMHGSALEALTIAVLLFFLSLYALDAGRKIGAAVYAVLSVVWLAGSAARWFA